MRPPNINIHILRNILTNIMSIMNMNLSNTANATITMIATMIIAVVALRRAQRPVAALVNRAMFVT